KNFRAGFDFVGARKLKIRTDYNDFRLATSAGPPLQLQRLVSRTEPQSHQRPRWWGGEYGRALPVEQDLENRHGHLKLGWGQVSEGVQIRSWIHLPLRDGCRIVLNNPAGAIAG